MSQMNRHPIKQWEITFPQCGVIERETFVNSFPPTEYAICAQEEHADGGLHLHLGIKLLKPLTHSKLIKYLKEKFPDDWKRIHVSAIKNWDNWNDYCKKEDPNVFISGSLVKRVSATVKKAMELVGDEPKESWAEYLANKRREDKEDMDAVQFFRDKADWKKQWNLEERILRERCTDPLDLKYELPFFEHQRDEAYLKFLQSWEP